MMALTKLGNNFYTVKIANLRVWYSYKTPIAYKYDGEPVMVSKNIWSRTTGKHINQIKQICYRERDYIEVDHSEILKVTKATYD